MFLQLVVLWRISWTRLNSHRDEEQLLYFPSTCQISYITFPPEEQDGGSGLWGLKLLRPDLRLLPLKPPPAAPDSDPQILSPPAAPSEDANSSQRLRRSLSRPQSRVIKLLAVTKTTLHVASSMFLQDKPSRYQREARCDVAEQHSWGFTVTLFMFALMDYELSLAPIKLR